MKTKNTLIIVIGIIVIIAIIYFIIDSARKESIKQAAISSGIPPKIANDVANSSNAKRSLLSLGVPDSTATLISLGTSIQNTQTEIYKCTYTDPKSGAVTTKDGACTQVDANNGWITSSK